MTETRFKKLGFRHGGVIYTSDSFETLKVRVLELGAHRTAGPGTGVDLRLIITPIAAELYDVLAEDFTVVNLDRLYESDEAPLPGLDRETATEILANLAADEVKDERRAEVVTAPELDSYTQEQLDEGNEWAEHEAGIEAARELARKHNDALWIGAASEDPAITAKLTPEEIADYRADRVEWEQVPFPADNLVFFCPQDEHAEDQTRRLFRKVLATVNAGRTVHLEAASNPNLRNRCFYVITDRVDA